VSLPPLYSSISLKTEKEKKKEGEGKRNLE
jgi:hypothetical protein